MFTFEHGTLAIWFFFAVFFYVIELIRCRGNIQTLENACISHINRLEFLMKSANHIIEYWQELKLIYFNQFRQIHWNGFDNHSVEHWDGFKTSIRWL